jgi:aminocarboxymuconate-semialdehyde decarboxylase
VIADVHAHILPPALLEQVRAGRWADGLALQERDGRATLLVEGRSRGAVEPGLLDTQRRLAAMDAAGIEVQILSSWVGAILHRASVDLAVRWARAFNDALADLIATHPLRFLGLGQVALQNPGAAAAELRRIMRDPSFVGVEITTRVGEHDLDEPALDAFWEAASQIRCLVLIHPDRALSGRLTPKYAMSNTIGNPVETTIAAMSLISGGVLDRHPGLSVCLVHGGGTLPYQIGRIGHAHLVAPGSIGSMPAPPHTYLRRFHFDTLTHSPEVLAFLRGLVGSDRLVLGSDHPFAMGVADPAGELDKGLTWSAADRERVLGGNVERLLADLRRPG